MLSKLFASFHVVTTRARIPCLVVAILCMSVIRLGGGGKGKNSLYHSCVLFGVAQPNTASFSFTFVGHVGCK